jgi:hypothetical protein
MRPGLLLPLLGILFSLIGVGVAYALSQDAPFVDRTSLGPNDRAAQAPGAAAVAPLRREQVEADRLPGAVADGPLLADGIADVASARRVGANSESGWIMPGRNDSICHARNGFLNCAPAQYVEQRGLAPSAASRDGTFRIEGIAADSVDSVIVRLWDDSVVAAPVSNNAFLIKASQPVREVRWQGPNGPESMSFEWFYRLSAQQQQSMQGEAVADPELAPTPRSG